jgi:UDP-glucose/iron transport system ATP-binding protein
MLFSLERVTVSRAGRTVLSEVSCQLEEGATAIVGPSGAGKSTLLRLLNRLADPDEGEVSYRGRKLSAYEVLALRREVALVPQLPALLEGSVADNVTFGARLAGREADIGRALRLAGLRDEFAGRDARQLSVGEQQRVMLARALALDPTVLLLDEPTSALDPDARGAIEATLSELRERVAVSIVLVTHDLDQAARLSERWLRLEEGRLVDGALMPATLSR